MGWFYNSQAGTKSAGGLDHLVKDVLLAPDFLPEDLQGFSAKTELRRMSNHANGPHDFPAEDGWCKASVEIPLPKAKVKHDSEAYAPIFTVENIVYRPLLASIKAAYEDAVAERFHFVPFKLFSLDHDLPSPPQPERLYSEAYNTDTLLRLQGAIQEKAMHDREPGDSPSMEYVVAPIGIYSDSTHLANFGTASLWPICFWVLSLTKYIRATPTSFAAHHLAYIPSLPNLIRRAYEDIYGNPPTEAVLRFCKKELVQQIWMLLLDDDFVRAYAHGIVVKCGDGITRRLFPRILTYSADYPEKCLIACIKFLGRCPCPACLIDKAKIYLLGTKRDMTSRQVNLRKDTSWLRSTLARVRGWLFERRLAPEGKGIEAVLGPTSTSPNQSAFSRRLAVFGFDIYQALVPDVMHEFELGVWKSIMTHLVRILTVVGASSVNELNARFAQVPTFGRDAIRRFGDEVSALKKMAAHNYEDLIQCAIPVFEGLLRPAHDRKVQKLLFRLAVFHALAKLRLHTDTTLSIFESAVKTLGEAIRTFATKVCREYDTRELDKEVAARQRRKAKKDSKGKAPAHVPKNAKPEDMERPRKEFNPNTYKLHRLGDYPASIRKTGTMDDKSTQTGELEHRRPKRHYAHTNKNAGFTMQIAHHECRERFAWSAAKRGPQCGSARSRRKTGVGLKNGKAEDPSRMCLGAGDDEPLAPISPLDHYKISQEQRYHEDIYGFVYDNEDDPIVENFIPNLHAHILARLLFKDAAPPSDFAPSRADLAALRISNNRLYKHKRMLVNYTSYDMRRKQDTINPLSHPDILLLTPPGSTHPYLYARVLSIFHVNVSFTRLSSDSEETSTLHILFVRWFNLDDSIPWGFDSCRLPRLQFASLNDEPFGFISPEQVLRGVHLIPAFAHGRSNAALPGYSIARPNEDEDKDWNYHYVGIFSDRDLFMRYLGGGVGHGHFATASSPATAPLHGNGNVHSSIHSDSSSDSGLDSNTDGDSDVERPAALASDSAVGTLVSDEDNPSDNDGDETLENEPNDEELDYGYLSSSQDSDESDSDNGADAAGEGVDMQEMDM
ncbi:hypothetical protein C8Q78DRAFT_985227 [Trametes maxima]|nr:hypothetical protein C8Q78DRAFT_985227 [Trametes maxima]